MRTAIGIILVLGLAGVSQAQDSGETAAITLGNGEANWIMVEGVERSSDSTYTEQRITSDSAAIRRGDGTTLTFPEVHIESDGWLVVHPFIEGRPNGDYVAGYTFVESGTNRDVKLTINPAPESGTMYLVMLHSDSNSDGVFDFVFVDDTHVEDRAVFEGNRMIAHVFAVP
ncbi:hypothetical protein [uncultured Erythrobacter sp.]|uniref:DUF7282 domain-containing protein n=1 Tax=uncultured Erythrobacter sp. TaxID=263913 RepID=UPI0026273036|nr:hypothetical protein [uncultured Erythrobacter sp.]